MFLSLINQETVRAKYLESCTLQILEVAISLDFQTAGLLFMAVL